MADILIKENSIPIFHAAYSVPFKLRERVEVELDRLVKENIIIPIRTSRWASPIVVVPKPDGQIRLCLDYSVTINKCILTEHYPLPQIEDIFASLSGQCNLFCVVELKGADQQLLVSEQSRQYLTMNNMKGLYQYTRLPFEISSALSIFQAIMDQILVGIKETFCYLDDILIGGSPMEKCKDNLFIVLERLNKYNVKINLSKCKFLETKTNYLGHTLSEKAISPNSDRVKAIVDAPPPTNVLQLQSYLSVF